MKITSVTYRTNRPTAGSKYIHEHVEATCLLEGKETPEAALAKLKTRVQTLLYPELVGLRETIEKMSPAVGEALAGLDDAQLVAMFHANPEAFDELVKGDIGPREFLRAVMADQSI